jgi:hypothetical protein
MVDLFAIVKPEAALEIRQTASRCRGRSSDAQQLTQSIDDILE